MSEEEQVQPAEQPEVKKRKKWVHDAKTGKYRPRHKTSKKKPGPKPKKPPLGRPWAFQDEAVVSKLEHAFSIGCNIAEACYHAGISRQTYYENIKQFPEYADKFQDLQARPHLRARNTVFEALQIDRMLAWDFLQKTHPEEFAIKKKMELSGTVNVETVNYADADTGEDTPAV